MPEPLELIAKARLALEESTTSDDKIKITADDKARDPEAVQVAAAAAKIKGRVPISMLLRYHFLALALHTLVVCFASASVCECSWLSPVLFAQPTACTACAPACLSAESLTEDLFTCQLACLPSCLTTPLIPGLNLSVLAQAYWHIMCTARPPSG